MNCIKCSDFSLAENNGNCGCYAQEGRNCGCCAQEETNCGCARNGRETMCCRARRIGAEEAIIETFIQTLRNLQDTDALRELAENLMAFTGCCDD